MKTKPKISIITASKNGGRFWRQTLDSIRAQSFTDYEHVIADCVSTDNTLEILKEYQSKGYNIRWVSKQDKSADEGFYNALQMAKGEYIMFCCVSDGYLDKDWFQKCVDVLDNDPQVSLVYGLTVSRMKNGAPGKIRRPNFFNYPPQQKMDFFPFWLGTFMEYHESTLCARANIFKECFPKYGGGDYFLDNHAVFGFYYNFSTKGYLPYFLPDVATFIVAHNDSNSAKWHDFNVVMRNQYHAAVVKYGNRVLSGKIRHYFRDGNSNVIKAIEPYELKLYRRKVLDFRINRKFYLGGRGARHLSYWLRKFKILIGYFLCRKRIFH